MHSPFLLVAILSLLVLSAAAQECTVNLPILTSLPNPLTLNIQNSTWILNKSPVQYISLCHLPCRFRDNRKLHRREFIHNSSPIYTVVSVFVPPAEVFRYVRFQLGGEPLSVEAQYGCDKDGNEQVEFMPVSGGATQLGFCVVQDRAGTYDLSLKPRFGNNNPCIDMVLATAR